MFEHIKKRIAAIESRILNILPFFPDDSDGFLSALGVDLKQYEEKNQDGTKGYDAIRALSDCARTDWNTDEWR